MNEPQYAVAAPGQAAGARQVAAGRPRPTTHRRALAAAFALDTVAACLAATAGRRGAGRHRRRGVRRASSAPWAARRSRTASTGDLNGDAAAGGRGGPATLAATLPPWRCAPTCRRCGRPTSTTRWRGCPRAASRSWRTPRGVGTTLYTAPYDAFDPRFGPGSARGAPRRRGRRGRRRCCASLRRDVDDLADLAAAQALGLGTAHAPRSVAGARDCGRRRAGAPPRWRPVVARRRWTSWRPTSWRCSSSPVRLLGRGRLLRGARGRRLLGRLAAAFVAGDFVAADFAARGLLRGRLLGRRLRRAPSWRRDFVAVASWPGTSSRGWPSWRPTPVFAVAFLAATWRPPRPPWRRPRPSSRRCRRRRRSAGQLLRAGDDVLEVGAGGELRHRRLLGLDPLAGAGVAHGAGLADPLLEGAEPGDRDLLAPGRPRG